MELESVVDIPIPPGSYGDIERRTYNIYDYQNRLIDIYNYYNEEIIEMVENDNGEGVPYSNVPVPSSGASAKDKIVDNLKFTWDPQEGELDPGHRYKWNQRFKILGLDLENNLWKHDVRRIDGTHVEIDSYSGQW